MATFDPREQRMAVRIVYDGVACAGKTTNLRQLCTLFAAQRGSEVYSPADLHGRTLFFDWMQILAGVVCGFPLMCQVVSVPGQVVLTPRRRHLLASADVVVYVCESRESSIRAARDGLAIYEELERERGTKIPLVVQANKQDRPGAIGRAELLRALGRDAALPSVEAIASEGIGVVDTFVTAVRAVVQAMQARASEDATDPLRVDVRRADTAIEVLSRLAEEQLDPEWAAEMILEEAHAAFMLEETTQALSADTAHRARSAAAASALTRATATDSAKEPSSARPSPPLPPSENVPTGFIWPAHTGRAVVTSLGLAGVDIGDVDDAGRLEHARGGYVARTSIRARFADAEGARNALVRAARENTQLDRLLVPETVLVAQEAADGACWIWTITPELPTVEALLDSGDAFGELVMSYGQAVVEALRASMRHGFSFDLLPKSFGVQNGELRYIGELLPQPLQANSVAAVMVEATGAVSRAGGDANAFVEAFERELDRRLTKEELARMGTRARGLKGVDSAAP